MWLPRSRERPPRSSRALGAAAIEEAKLAHPSADEVVQDDIRFYEAAVRRFWYDAVTAGLVGRNNEIS